MIPQHTQLPYENFTQAYLGISTTWIAISLIKINEHPSTVLCFLLDHFFDGIRPQINKLGLKLTVNSHYGIMSSKIGFTKIHCITKC